MPEKTLPLLGKSETAGAPTPTVSGSKISVDQNTESESISTVASPPSESKDEDADDASTEGGNNTGSDDVPVPHSANPVPNVGNQPTPVTDGNVAPQKRGRGRPRKEGTASSVQKPKSTESVGTGIKQSPLETVNESGSLRTGRLVAVDTAKLILRPPFNDLLPIDERTRESIRSSMENNGFDETLPIHVWKNSEELLVTDGCTRTLLARELGIPSIPAFIHDFPDENAALEFAMDCQVKRRNLSDGDLVRFVELYDEKIIPGSTQTRAEGGTFQPKASGDALGGKTATQTAAKLGVSTSKVERARHVNQKADETTKQAVRENKLSVNAALKQIKKATKKQSLDSADDKPGDVSKSPLFPFDQLENSNVAFSEWSLLRCEDPVLSDDPSLVPETKVPKYLLDETKLEINFGAKALAKLPNRRVLVSQGLDLFDAKVPAKTIRTVLEAATAAQDFEFLFTTSNPERLDEFSWEINTFAGVSIFEQRDVAAAEKALLAMKGLGKWLVIEQLKMELRFEHLDQIDWLVVRQEAGKPGVAIDPHALKSLLQQAWATKCPVLFERGVTYQALEAPKARKGAAEGKGGTADE